ncbi:MAG TPA: GIY-YIG nuclease family protein [Ruminococcus sp.]|nr:GIY-YIG nuclease family protein [Ruminococcus sp.]
MYYVYIIKCKGGLLYTGITTDMERRFAEHSGRLAGGAKFTRSHPPESIEAVWSASDRSTASKLEYVIKQLTKAQKLELIADDSCLSRFFGEDSRLYHREEVSY